MKFFWNIIWRPHEGNVHWGPTPIQGINIDSNEGSRKKVVRIKLQKELIVEQLCYLGHAKPDWWQGTEIGREASLWHSQPYWTGNWHQVRRSSDMDAASEHKWQPRKWGTIHPSRGLASLLIRTTLGALQRVPRPHLWSFSFSLPGVRHTHWLLY